MPTITMPVVTSESRYSRLANARAYAKRIGRKPLTSDERKELMQAVADCTNI